MKKLVNKLEKAGISISAIFPVTVTGNKKRIYNKIRAEFDSALILTNKRTIIIREEGRSYKIKIA